MTPSVAPARRWIYVGLGGLLVLALGAWIYAQRIEAAFDPDPPQATGAKPADSAEARKQDLDVLRRAVALDRSMSAETRKDVEGRLEAAASEAGSFSGIGFELEIAAALARIDNAETEVSLPERRQRLSRLPIRMAPLADGLYVVKATAPFAELLGWRVSAIGGVASDEALKRFDPYHGGPDWLRRYAGRDLWHAVEALQAVGLTPLSNRVEITFLKPDATYVTKVFQPLPGTLDGAPPYAGWMDFTPGAKPGREDEDWRDLIPAAGAAPVSEPTLDEAVSFVRLDRPNAVLVTIANEGLADKDLAARLEAVITGLTQAPPHHLILNLRRVGQGSIEPWRAFLAALPQALPDGAVFVLTAPSTGSVGVEVIARLRAKLPERVLHLGLPPGTPASFWRAAPRKILLPNSKIQVAIATRKVDWDKGCASWRDCGFAASREAVTVGPLPLDVTFATRIEDYVKGKDTAVEVIKALIGQAD